MSYLAYSRSPIHVREVQAGVDPGFGVGDGDHISNELPGGVPPIGATLPEAPPGIWPPPSWNHPWVPIPPDETEPPEPGTIWPPVAEHPPHDGKFWVVAGIPGVGWRYVCVDITQKPPGAEKPPMPGKPPTAAAPKV